MCVVWNNAATCYFKAMQRDPFKDFNNAKHNYVSLFFPPTTRWAKTQLLMLSCTDVSGEKEEKAQTSRNNPFLDVICLQFSDRLPRVGDIWDSI